ncbi:hypothetical protein L484_024832 [Morus notabilis]|uniref:Localized to the inner membrane of the chloroplast n=1 Tax=Morus notabilis TaxID=981085 RepID=W9QWH0_9ROSA|nr:uncharacterized protein LOC21407557 [Morus notabilis]EXB56293.1 hypothetical protein L484_024832 [Morus notabilis]
MAALSNSVIATRNHGLQISSGPSLKRSNEFLGSAVPANLSFNLKRVSKKSFAVQAAYSDGERPSSAGIFIGGFVLGGIIVGTLGCVYAPQISKALTGTDRKDLMRKLPKFIYDEEKALEKTRKVLAEKIAQLNSAIDDVSSQLRTEDGPNGVAVGSDEIEAAI